MFNQFIKNINTSIEALPLLSAMQQPPPNKPTSPEPQLDLERLVQTILRLLSQILSEKLGEAIDEGQFKELAGELMRSRAVETQLVQAKEKYNQLAGRSSGLFQQARKISASIGEFITSINLFLESEELLVPLREIQKGINELTPQRVEKQVNYLIRIFQSNFEEVIERRIRAAEASLHEEIKLLKNLNKNLEGELLSIKNNKNQDQSKVYELSLRISALNQKIAKLTSDKVDLQRALKTEQSAIEQHGRESAQQEREVMRLRGRETELLERVRLLEVKASRSQRSLKEQSTEAEALNSVIERLKLKQEEITEEMERESKRREAASDTLRKKLQNEKIALQEQLQRLRERYTELEVSLALKQDEVARLNEEIRSQKEKGDIEIDLDQPEHSQGSIKEGEEQPIVEQSSNNLSESRQKISLSELKTRLANLENKNKELQSKLGKQQSSSVNKEVLRSLFLNYDDESKEWSVRRNIKYQICTLLGLKDRLPQLPEQKPSKWFGLF